MMRYLKRIFTVVVGVLFAVYIYQNFKNFGILTRLNLKEILILSILYLLTLITTGIFSWLQTKSLGIKIGIEESIHLSNVSAFGNMVLPFRGGMGMKAYYLKQKYKLSYTYFLASLAGLYVLTFLVLSFVGMISILIYNAIYNRFNILLFVFYLLLASMLAVFISIDKKIINKIKFPFKKKLEKLIEGWEIINKSRINLVYMLLTIAFNVLISALILKLQFDFLEIKSIGGKSIGMLDTFYLNAVSYLSVFINLTPSGLGIRELLFFMSSQFVRISENNLILISVLDRIMAIINLSIFALLSRVLLKIKFKS